MRFLGRVAVITATAAAIGAASASSALAWSGPATPAPTSYHSYITTTQTLSGCHVRGHGLYATNAGWDYRCVQRFDGQYDLWLFLR